MREVTKSPSTEVDRGVFNSLPFSYVPRANLQVYFTLAYIFFEHLPKIDHKCKGNFQNGPNKVNHKYYLVTNQVIWKGWDLSLLCYPQ